MRIGALLESATPPEQMLTLAGRAADAGLTEVWVSEDYYRGAAPSAAAAILAAHPSLRVGIGTIPAFPRHAAVSAMEIATLNRMFPGRTITSIGHGLPLWMKQMGVMPDSSIAGLAESFGQIRRLLDGGTLPSADGSGTEYELTFPTPDLPLWLAVTGPKMLDLSGRIADGTLFSMLAGPTYVGWARERLAEAAGDEQGRAPHQTAAFVLFGPSAAGDDVRTSVRTMVAQMLARRPDSFMIARTPFAADLKAMAEQGVDHLLRHLPDEYVDEFVVWGDEAACRDRLLALEKTGLDRAVLAPVTGIDKGEAMSVIATLQRHFAAAPHSTKGMS